ncbi:MAG: serine/threonine-protein kinase [Gloeotrichia echinulata IR180]|nr:serine/threonine protein kinase [Gloeotrichia echinulata DEX184]
MSPITQTAIHCINPDCQRPYPQPWGNKFCNSCGAPLHLLNRYVPLQPLGSGGFAQIYTVWDEKIQTEKVLKVLVENSPKALELFTQEAGVLSSLINPGVPRVDVDGYFQLNLSNPKSRQLPCLVMEKINGETLEEILNKYPQGCPEDLVLNWCNQVVQILKELHKRQIIHRDIKPSNLMLRTTPSVGVTGGNRLVLIDFGGAKQFDAKLAPQSSSTRLFSSGYSPPEQIIGRNVGPGADFYALGRTMIELLTGKYPPQLEDPQTGTLRWRQRVSVNPKFADLLDEMVQEDVRSRPANASIIHKRLAKISPGSSQQGLLVPIQDAVRQGLANIQQALVPVTPLIQAVKQANGEFNKAVGKIALSIVKAIAKFLLACLTTIWTMILTGIGACLGTSTGWIFGYETGLGDRITKFILPYLPDLSVNTQSSLGAEVLVFVGAGLGTAWGLTAAGSFGQRRRFLLASMMGIISYGLAWLVWQLTTPTNSNDGLAVSIVFAVFLFTVSLDLRSHHIVYAVIASFATALVFAGLIHLGFLDPVLQFSIQPDSQHLSSMIAFFAFVAIFQSFCMGVCYYLIVPGLRFLGWR